MPLMEDNPVFRPIAGPIGRSRDEIVVTQRRRKRTAHTSERAAPQEYGYWRILVLGGVSSCSCGNALGTLRCRFDGRSIPKLLFAGRASATGDWTTRVDKKNDALFDIALHPGHSPFLLEDNSNQPVHAAGLSGGSKSGVVLVAVLDREREKRLLADMGPRIVKILIAL